MTKNIRNFDLEELKAILSSLNEPHFRAEQIYKWLYIKGIEDFSKMTDVPEQLRNTLSRNFTPEFLKPEEIKSSKDGTKKILFRLYDNKFIESVIIPEGRRTTVCISTQIGCKYKCTFCASGKTGFIRNLHVWEMLSQILYPLFKEHLHITNVVFMGMGEPFDNYEAVLKTIRMINDKKGINIGMRKITVSTAGIVPRIMEFAELKSQVRLSISLHSAIDETRSFLMPINKKYPLPELIKACQFYRRMTGRKLTFEYVLFENVNDNEKHALALADLSLLIDADVNIIPFSKIPGCKLTRTSIWKTEKFLQTLKKKRVRATIRKSRGSDINAACGQLAGIKK